MFYIVNDELLYFMKQDFDYQSVIRSVRLQPLYDSQTNQVINLGPIYQVGDKFCFNVKQPPVIFKVCQKMRETGEGLRLALRNQVLRLFGRGEEHAPPMKCGRYQDIDFSF